MALFPVLPPAFVPYVVMDRWGVVIDNKHGIRLVGREIGDAERITSAVVEWHADSQTATTRSGRFYRLVGDPDPEYAERVVAMHKRQWGDRAEVEFVDRTELEQVSGGSHDD